MATIQENYVMPVTPVIHKDLESFSGDYKKKCPFCKDGLLLVKRNPETFELEEEDHCVSCGRRVIYKDIEEMRRKLG